MKILSLSVISLLLFIAITDFKVGRWMGCCSPPFFINFILLSDLRCMYILGMLIIYGRTAVLKVTDEICLLRTKSCLCCYM